MLVVANHLQVAEGYEEEFLDRFEQQAARIRGRPGLTKVEILRPVDADEFIIQAYWESKEAFDQWRTSDDFHAAHSNLPPEMFAGPNHLEIYESVMKIQNEEHE